ncbi:MAG: hypothetical protein WA160_08310 [Pseudobdellovibrio sp.]
MKKYGFIFALISLVLTLVLTRTLSEVMKNSVPSHDKVQKRFEALLQNISEISKDSNNKTLFVGTSIFQYFLDPSDFDEAMQSKGVLSKSYNLGFEGNIGSGTYAMMNRLETEFKSRNAHFKNIIFEFSPACLNKTFYNNHLFVIDIRHPQIFLDNQTWDKIFIQNAPAAAYLLTNQILKPLDWEFLSYRKLLGFADYKKKLPGVADAFSSKIFYEVPEWDIKSSGLSNWNLPKTTIEFENLIEDIHEVENWKSMIFRYRIGNGISSSFSYEPSLVNYYIESVRAASRMADNVILVILPYAPSFQKSVDEFVDYEYLINKFSKETNAKIIDYRKSFSNTDNDFADAMHLRKENMKRYMNILGHELSTK